MSFRLFCALHALDAACRWTALVQALQRRRLVKEREAVRARIVQAAIDRGEDSWN